MNDSHRRDTTASLPGTSRCTYAIEPPCTEPYARWCERSELFSSSYSIYFQGLTPTYIVIQLKILNAFANNIKRLYFQDFDFWFDKLFHGNTSPLCR